MAFFGDQGRGANARAVLELVKREGASMVLHLGDFDYDDDPAAFDASENDFKRHRGFRHEGEWLVNNKCDTATRLVEVNAGKSGCGPAPLRFRLEGANVVLTENDVLEGWRFFR